MNPFLIFLSVVWLAVCSSSAFGQTERDEFYWLAEMNKASAVMVVSTGIVDPALGKTIANAIAKVNADAAVPGADRPWDYLKIEPKLIAAGGPDVTRLHSGRSRQDMLSTSQRLFLRDAYLEVITTLNDYRAALFDLALSQPDAIMPAYTMGVQAQPITVGHYVSGYLEALGRQAQRVEQAYARVNLSPLGAAAVGTSSFPTDRNLLATLLGFNGIVENSFDANHVSPFDLDVETGSLAMSSAITSGALLADLLDQYRLARPWFLLAAGETTTSSIMPQKRNPLPLLAARELASRTLGGAQSEILIAHNIGPGVIEYRGKDARDALLSAAHLHSTMAKLIRSLRFDAGRALEEVNSEYSTSTELADVLQREANVPFRVGHHFVSELVNYGRANGLVPAVIPFDQVERIYAATAKEALIDQGGSFPLTEARFREALTAENMIRSSKGIGGPQPAEVARMLEVERASLKVDQGWVDNQQRALAEASEHLNDAFERLRR